VRELESSLQQFGDFLLKSRFVKEAAAPYCAVFVRQFLSRPATDEALVDRVRRFCEDLERTRSDVAGPFGSVGQRGSAKTNNALPDGGGCLSGSVSAGIVVIH
jgi:hypothetical protein